MQLSALILHYTYLNTFYLITSLPYSPFCSKLHAGSKQFVFEWREQRLIFRKQCFTICGKKVRTQIQNTREAGRIKNRRWAFLHKKMSKSKTTKRRKSPNYKIETQKLKQRINQVQSTSQEKLEEQKNRNVPGRDMRPGSSQTHV